MQPDNIFLVASVTKPVTVTAADLTTPGTFGHGGATGTVVWADPARELICIIFTTEPTALNQGILGRCSNLAAAAAV